MRHDIRRNGFAPVMYAELDCLRALGQCYGDGPGMITVVKRIGYQVGKHLPHPGDVKLAKCLLAALQDNCDLRAGNAKLVHKRMAHLGKVDRFFLDGYASPQVRFGEIE